VGNGNVWTIGEGLDTDLALRPLQMLSFELYMSCIPRPGLQSVMDAPET